MPFWAMLLQILLDKMYVFLTIKWNVYIYMATGEPYKTSKVNEPWINVQGLIISLEMILPMQIHIIPGTLKITVNFKKVNTAFIIMALWSLANMWIGN